MSCQPAPTSRSQDDPYTFTESTTLPASSALFKQQQPVTVTASASPATPTSVPVIQAGTSLLTSNNNNIGNVTARLNHVVQQQRTLLGTTTAKLAPIKVTLVQSPSGGILGKARLNGTTITSSPQGTVFRTVTVPQATTIVQRPMAPGSVAGTATANTTPTVFTKPLQVQISPQQAAAVAAAGGKFTARRILASKSPNVSPGMATAVSGPHPSGIQTVRIVKTTQANMLQPLTAGRSVISADGTRRFLSHSGGTASLLGSPVVVTTSLASAVTPQQQQQLQQSSPQQLPTISPTKIRLIQPQPQGKIFLHTPNSSNSLAAATHISNPISIAALRNSLAKQNPSLLNKIVVQQQQHQQQQPQSHPQQVQIAVSSGSATSNGLPTVRMIPTSTAVTAINIRRAVPASAATVTAAPKRQLSLETGTTTTTVMVPTLAKAAAPQVHAAGTPPGPVVVKQVKVIPASAATQQSPAGRPQTIQIPQTLLQQRAKTPTQSILKPQPPRPQQTQTLVKPPQKLVIAAPKTPQQQQQQQLLPNQQLHPQQVMVLASPKSLGAGGQQQQQVMVVSAPKTLGAGGQQQHQVVVLAPFKPNQLTQVTRQGGTHQLLTASMMKQIQQQQQQQILAGQVVKQVQKVQQPQPVVKQIQQAQVVTSPVVRQLVQNQIVVKQAQQQQQQQQPQTVLATAVAKTIQQRQIVATPVVKQIQQQPPPQQQQQQIVVTSVARSVQPAQPQVVTTAAVVKPVQQQQPQQVVLTPVSKPPQQLQQQHQTQPPQQFVVIPPPKQAPQPPQQQQLQLPQHVTAVPQPAPPPPPPPAPTPPPTTTTPKVPQQDDFTIPSFIIPKQKEVKNVPEKVVPSPPPVPVAPQAPVPPAPPVAAITPPVMVPEPQLPSTSSSSTSSPPVATLKPKEAKVKEKRATKRSYSRSSHHETLERIDEPPAAPPMPKIHKWTAPGAISVPVNREWHAPDSWIFDICPPGTRSYEELENAPLAMDCWFEETYAGSEFDADMLPPRKAGVRKREAELPLDDGGELVELSLEKRSELRKAFMRRRAVQYWNAQRLRDPEPARKRLKAVERVLKKLEKHRVTMLSKNGGAELPKCQRPDCERDALLATTHCQQHIADNSDQRLFQRCTAKFSDNSQCQVPVFDVSHELILCREHAWKHDNHDKMSAEVRLLKKPSTSAIIVPTAPAVFVAAKKKQPKMPLVKVVQPVHHQLPIVPASSKHSKTNKKKKKLTPFQQQMALHQQQYKQQYAVKPTLPPPPYPTQTAAVKPVYRQQQSQVSKYQPPAAPVQIVPPSQINRNLHIPLNNQSSQQQRVSYPQQQQQHMIGRNEDLMLNYAGQQQQHQSYSHQQVQHILTAVGGAGSNATQDLLNICENSSAYASSEDTGVGGLSESELMAAQDVIEEIPFEIGNLNNVLSQLPPDAFNELLFSEQEQNGPTFESTREEEEDLERALEAVGEHVKSLEDMTVESANLFGDFLDNVDDEMLDEQMLVVQSPGGPNDIRGLVHT